MMIHRGHQDFETDINPDRRPRSRMPIGEVTVDLHREGHEPALGAPGDGGGEDPGPSLRQLASQGLGGLVGAEGAQPGEGDRGPRTAHHPMLKRKESRHRPFDPEFRNWNLDVYLR
jgi:hypothetical protein